jgi:hypothetical protein
MNRNIDIIAIAILVLAILLISKVHNVVSVAIQEHAIRIGHGPVVVVPVAPRPPLPPLPRISLSMD